jgi:hypothetical protein
MKRAAVVRARRGGWKPEGKRPLGKHVRVIQGGRLAPRVGTTASAKGWNNFLYQIDDYQLLKNDIGPRVY